MHRSAEPTARVVHRDDYFAHEHAREIHHYATKRSKAPMVVVDLSAAVDTSTAALAALILLRRTLMGKGRDLRLTGLSGRPLLLYQVNRLDSVLPFEPQESVESDVCRMRISEDDAEGAGPRRAAA